MGETVRHRLGGLDDDICRDARAWSVHTARELVRHLRAPHASLALSSLLLISAGTANLLTTLVLLPRLGLLVAALLAGAGVVVSLFGMLLATRYIGVVAQHRVTSASSTP